MSVSAPHGTSQKHPARGRTVAYSAAAVLLAAPFVALLWVSSYAKDKPRLFGFPFFYWYQFVWVLISAVLTLGAYVLVRRVERPRARLGNREGGPR
jgi:membrane protein implicated in regulation of membrane protease activity